jgi:hypothetical protein
MLIAWSKGADLLMDVTDLAGLESIADVRGPREYRLEAVVEMVTRLLCDLVQQGVRAVLGWRCAGWMGWRRSRGAMDIGQGSNSVIAQILATALGADVRDLALVGPDTDVTPDAGKTSAPRQTFVSGNAAWLAGVSLRVMILERCNAAVDAVLRFDLGVVEVTDGAGVHRVELAELARTVRAMCCGPKNAMIRRRCRWMPMGRARPMRSLAMRRIWWWWRLI